MKELSIEEKAKRYDEAIEIAKKINNEQKAQPFNVMTRVFPELKEGEDEKIRKVLIHIVKGACSKYGIKYQGQEIDEEKLLAWLEKQGEHANFRNKIQIGDKVTRNEDGVLVNLSQLNRVAKKQGENNMGISEATKQKLEDNLNKALEKETPESCNEFLDKQGEQNPAWSEEDETKLKSACALIRNTSLNGNEDVIDSTITFLKSLKDKVQPKQEWREEDENAIQVLRDIVKHSNEINENIYTMSLKEKLYDWLKSIKERCRWKPSDEQMNTLEYYMHNLVCTKHKEILFGLYSDLKKIKG